MMSHAVCELPKLDLTLMLPTITCLQFISQKGSTLSLSNLLWKMGRHYTIWNSKKNYQCVKNNNSCAAAIRRIGRYPELLLFEITYIKSLNKENITSTLSIISAPDSQINHYYWADFFRNECYFSNHH